MASTPAATASQIFMAYSEEKPKLYGTLPAGVCSRPYTPRATATAAPAPTGTSRRAPRAGAAVTRGPCMW